VARSDDRRRLTNSAGIVLTPPRCDDRLETGTIAYSPQSQLVDARAGSLPLLLTAPHGGIEQPEGVPERSHGLRRLDGRTRILGEHLVPRLQALLGGRPYVVFARFHRRYLDANRPADQGVEHEAARIHYDAYHGAVRSYVDEIRMRFGGGLLLDLHGQSAETQAIFRGTQNGRTTAKLLQRGGIQALGGPDSLFGQLESRGYDVYPAYSSCDLLTEKPGWSGGYTVQTYGSHHAEGIDAIQIELGWDLRTKETLPRLVADLADAIAAHHRAYFSDRGDRRSSWSSTGTRASTAPAGRGG
jgi:N-formylglutamate amidohydrolase